MTNLIMVPLTLVLVQVGLRHTTARDDTGAPASTVGSVSTITLTIILAEYLA